jgi:hypothetical protein
MQSINAGSANAASAMNLYGNAATPQISSSTISGGR